MKRLWVPRDPSCLDSGRTSTHSHHRTGKPGILHILYYIEKTGGYNIRLRSSLRLRSYASPNLSEGLALRSRVAKS